MVPIGLYVAGILWIISLNLEIWVLSLVRGVGFQGAYSGWRRPCTI